jgi:DNA-binding transcriptional regulator PaaX
VPPRVSSLPHNGERHALQALLSGTWKPERLLYPTKRRTLSGMVAKGWIEQNGGAQFEYKITDAGREAMRRQMP